MLKPNPVRRKICFRFMLLYTAANVTRNNILIRLNNILRYNSVHHVRAFNTHIIY